MTRIRISALTANDRAPTYRDPTHTVLDSDYSCFLEALLFLARSLEMGRHTRVVASGPRQSPMQVKAQ